jgi:hypothetical protein
MANYYVGLDLGQLSDYTAIAVLEEPIWVPSDAPAWVRTGEHNRVEQRSGWIAPADIWQQSDRRSREPAPPALPMLALRHLHRFERRTPYPEVVRHVADLLACLPLAGNAVLLVDATGVGRPVVDMLDQAKLDPQAITITGGSAVSVDGREYRVPKRDLAMCVQVLLQNRRLVFAAGLPLLDVLKRELQSFEVKIDPKTAHDSYLAWREGAHDDLVLAVALACWYREQYGGPSQGFSFSYMITGGRRL